MNNNTTLIAVAGLKGSGKSFLSEMLMNYMADNHLAFKTIAFADKLKEMLCEENNVTLEQVEKYKRIEGKLFKTSGGTMMNMRDMHTTIGARVGKEDPYYFVNIVKDKLNETNNMFNIISDLRIPEEVEYIMEENGLVVIVHDSNIKVKPSRTEDIDKLLKTLGDYKEVIHIDNTKKCIGLLFEKLAPVLRYVHNNRIGKTTGY